MSAASAPLPVIEPIPEAEPKVDIRANLGHEIYEIFVEEITEIHTNFQTWIPEWIANRSNKELLRDIRRGFHTCKGSGRMAGAFGLGDYAWAYEQTLNKVLENQLPANDQLSALLERSVSYLGERLDYFLTADKADAGVKEEIALVDRFTKQPDEALPLAAKVIAEVPKETEKLIPPLLSELDWGSFDSDAAETESAPESISEAPASAIEEEEVVQLGDLLAALPTSFDSLTVEPEPAAIIEAEQVAEPELPEFITPPEPVIEEDADIVSYEPVPAFEPAFLVPPPEAPAASKQKSFNENDENRIIWQMFREEVPEQLMSLDSLMQRLVANPEDKELCRSLERELHTLKGGARMAGLMDMGDLAHNAETTLEQMSRFGSEQASKGSLELLQNHIDQIHALAEKYVLEAPAEVEAVDMVPSDTRLLDKAIEAAKTEVPVAPVETKTTSEGGEVIEFAPVARDMARNTTDYPSVLEQMLIEKAHTLPDLGALFVGQASIASANDSLADELAAFSSQEQIRLPANFLDKMIDQAGALNVQHNGLSERLRGMGDDVREFSRTAVRLRQLLRSLELETEAHVHAGHSKVTPNASEKDKNFDPLEMDQYSEIQRLSRALAESLNDLVNIEADLSLQLRHSNTALNESLNTSRALQQDLLATRLIEASAVTPRLRRVVRQTALELNRQVSLDIDGEAMKIDRHLLHRITGPIEHLLRNAISHGIEPVEVRRYAGKPELGQLTLRIFREDSEIVIQVRDDGRGLDPTKLRQKALDLGLIRAHDVLSETEILRLILRPGFTTAESVTLISGRGVGMDVVSSEVKALGGSLQIQSTLNQGTSFTMRLPFAMAANPVLFVMLHNQPYAIPLGYVQGLKRLEASKIQQALHDPDAETEFNGRSYPLHYLGALLEPGQQMQLQDDHMYPVVFVRTGENYVAWLVDSITGRREVVLQSLGNLFKACRFYSAATITPDGQVVMLPDMAELGQRVQQVKKVEVVAEQQKQLPKRIHERPHILVVDDSITVRKVTEKLLASENYRVETARDGLDALEKLDEFEPDLLLMDIEMPRMDGFEVLGTMRQHAVWRHVPVIMISSRTAEKHRQHAEALGANSFLGKPYQNQELLELIRHHLAHSPLAEVAA